MSENEVIDTNVVEIKFDNSQFVDNVSQTIEIVNELKDSLQFDSSSFDSLEKATRNIDLSGITSSLESLSNRFSTFGIVGMTAIQRITNSAMTLGSKLLKLVAKPWQQIITGGTNRAANIAQAEFQLEGLFGKTDEGLAKLNMTMKASSDEIEKLTGMSSDLIVAMNAADYAVADTAYGLDSAAKAASVLATSGVDVLHFSEDLKDANGLLRTEMQVALRSISGTAAMANASYDDIAHVFERISGNGRVMAIDLQSLSARGLNAAATLRDYLNEIGVTANATEKDIRDMVSKGQIDFMTFAKAMDSTYGDHAKDANNTFQGAFSNMKFALSKIGADFISPFRDKMIPLFNDVRISINQIRKALNFKIKFPGLDKEISIVEMFSNAITNLSNTAHNFFTVWHGGQNVLEQAMSTITNLSGQNFSFVKNIFDEVKAGSRTSQSAISELTRVMNASGNSMSKVYKTLAENMDKTEHEITEMCLNGEISFEDFSNAISSTFGNIVAETRIEQLANLLKNLLSTATNLANGFSSVVGPVFEAFFDVFFKGMRVDGVVGVTQAISDFTSKLHLSVPAQRNLVKIFTMLFKVFKTGITIVGKLAGGVIKIIGAFSPLIEIVIAFASVFANILVYIVDFIAKAKVLDVVVKALTIVFVTAGKAIVAVLTIIISLVSVAIKAVASVFKILSDKIKNIDLAKIYEMIQAFKSLVGAFLAGGIIPILQRAITNFISAIGLFFGAIALAFVNLKDKLTTAFSKIRSTGTDLISLFASLGKKLKDTFSSAFTFIKENFMSLASIIAMLQSALAFGVLYNVTKVGSAITRAINSWANRNNAQALNEAANAIKKMATAFLIFAAAVVVLSLVPTERVLQTIGLLMAVALAIMGISFAIKRIMDAVTNARQAAQQIKPIEKAISNLINSIGGSIRTIANEVGRFLKNIGRAAVFASLAVLIISLAASMYILYKAVVAWGNIDPAVMAAGFENMGMVLASVAAAVAILGVACKGAGGGLIGAAVALLAFTAVLKMFVDIIYTYNSINMDLKEYSLTIAKIAEALLTMALAVGVMGLCCKKAGFGLIAGAINMLAFIVVLKAMKDIIKEYAEFSWDQFASDMSKCAVVLAAFVAAIYFLSRALGNTERGFSASLRGGIQYGSSKKQGLMGAIVAMLGIAVALKAFASVAKDISNTDGFAVLTTFGIMMGMLGGIIGMIQAMNGANGASVKGLASMILTVTLMVTAMSIVDPKRALSAAASISMVLLTLGNAIEQINNFGFGDSNQNARTIRQMILMLGSLTASLALLSAVGNWQNMLSAALAMGTIMVALTASLRLMETSHIDKKTFASMVAILGIATLFTAILSQISVKDPTALMALVTGLSILSLAVGAVVILLNKAGVIDNTAIGAFSALFAVISFMSLLLAGSAAIVGSTNSAGTFLELVTAIESLSFVVTGIVFLLNLINANPMIFNGVKAFAAIMGTIAVFGLLMAAIGTIGNVDNTITIMNALTASMNGLMIFLVSFSLILSLLGQLGPMILIGNAMFAILLTTIAGFAALLALFAMIGDVSNTISLMESLTECMKSLTTTMMEIIVVGALAIPAIAGVAILEGMIVSMIGLFTIIGGIQKIQNAILTGISLILYTCESINTMTTLMSGIDLNGILLFITALQMLSDINLIGLTKLAIVTTSLAAASTPMVIIGAMKRQIDNGCEAALNMMTSLVETFNLSKLLENLDADQLITSVNKLLKIANELTDYSSLMIVTGLASGLIDSRSRVILETAALGMAAIIDHKFKDVMGIHSPGEEPRDEWGHNTTAGLAIGLTDDWSKDLLTTATDTMAGYVNAEGISQMAIAGANSAESYAASFKSSLSGNLNIAGIVENVLAGGSLNAATGPAKKATKIIGKQLSSVGSYANGTSYGDNSPINPGGRPYYSPSLSDIEAQEKENDVLAETIDYATAGTDLFKLLEESIANIGSVSDLTSGSLDNLGGSLGSAAKSTDALTSKIDNLMDKYEEMWEDAKTNANKDLFKGVDKQGDDFLDSVQDIMDQYENIFKSAVERTNNQDLFAEVKENDESFAPDTLLNNLEDQVDQINELNTIISSLGGRIADNNLRAAISNMDVDDLPELRAMFRMSDSQLAEYEKLYQKKVQGNQNKIQNELTGSLSQITGQYTNIAEYVATDASTNMLIKNLQAQIDQLNEYNATVGSLMNRISDLNLREAIAHMGVDSLDELKMLNSMTSEQLDEYVEMYNAKIGREAQRIRNELSTELSTVLNQPIDIGEFYEMYRGAMSDFADMLGTDDVTTQAGKNVGSTLVNGASSGISESGSARTTGRDYSTNVADGMVEKDVLQRVEANANMVLDTILNVFTNAYDDLRSIGEEIINKICAGIDLGRRGAGFTNTLSTICFTISNALVVGSDFRWLSTGEAITNGITRGMNSSRAIENLENSARAIAAKAVNAVRQELQIASPSKVFMQIGRFVDEGFAQGLKDYSSLATIASEDMATNSLSAVQEAIMQLSGMLDGSIDLNPTITPTLDLSEINARSSALSDMFNGRQVAIAARADAQQAEMISQLGELMAKQPTVTNNTFNQTNNSPKALSRTEIYRQSKTAFSQFASAIS